MDPNPGNFGENADAFDPNAEQQFDENMDQQEMPEHPPMEPFTRFEVPDANLLDRAYGEQA